MFVVATRGLQRIRSSAVRTAGSKTPVAMVRGLLVALLCVGLVLGEEAASKGGAVEDTVITHARVESCGG